MPNKKRKPRRCPHCGKAIPRKRGDCIPYGLDPRRPKEAEGLKLILELRASGGTFRGIAEAMQAGGWKLRRGAKWNPGSICKFIKRAEFRAKKEAERELVRGETVSSVG